MNLVGLWSKEKQQMQTSPNALKLLNEPDNGAQKIWNLNEIQFLTVCFIEVDIDPLQLDIHITLIHSHCVNAMFTTDHLPELWSEWEKKWF